MSLDGSRLANRGSRLRFESLLPYLRITIEGKPKMKMVLSGRGIDIPKVAEVADFVDQRGRVWKITLSVNCKGKTEMAIGSPYKIFLSSEKPATAATSATGEKTGA